MDKELNTPTSNVDTEDESKHGIPSNCFLGTFRQDQIKLPILTNEDIEKANRRIQEERLANEYKTYNLQAHKQKFKEELVPYNPYCEDCREWADWQLKSKVFSENRACMSCRKIAFQNYKKHRQLFWK